MKKFTKPDFELTKLPSDDVIKTSGFSPKEVGGEDNPQTPLINL